MLTRALPLALAGLVIWANVAHGLAAYLALAAVLGAGLGRSRARAQPNDARGAQTILIATGILHFAVLFSAVIALTAPGPALAGQVAAAALAAGLFLGQVSNSAAHELIHAPDKARFWLGAAIYSSLMFGHHASAHRLVHHVHVATPADPNSAPRGTSLYRFLPRAWIGSFRKGLARETQLRAGGLWRTPYPAYVALSAAMLAISYMGTGWAGLVAHLALACYATLQLLTTDYVQHYGLQRRQDAHGKFAPVGPDHSWDAPGILAGWMTFNAPSHGAHHVRPTTPYGQLAAGPARMTLPYSLAVMGFIAFVPGWFRRVMRRPLERASAAQG